MSALKTLIYGQAKKFGPRSTSLLKIASDVKMTRLSEKDETNLITLFSALHHHPTISDYLALKIHDLLSEMVIGRKTNKLIVVNQGETFNVKCTFTPTSVYPDMHLLVKDDEIINFEQMRLSDPKVKQAGQSELNFTILSFPYTSHSIRFLSVYLEPISFTGFNVSTVYNFAVVVTNNISYA